MPNAALPWAHPLRLARVAGLVVGVLLLVSAVLKLMALPAPVWFFLARSWGEILLALILCVPFSKLVNQRLWMVAFLLLCAGAVAFTFGRVIGVMFEARAAAELGIRYGVPGFSGMLIFGVLSQIPVVFFLRYPDQFE